MRKWYAVELSVEDAVKLRIFLHDNSIKYEACGAYNLVAFQIELNNEEYKEVEKFLKEM